MNTKETPNHKPLKGVKSDQDVSHIGVINPEIDKKMCNMPGDMLSDLQDSFAIYDSNNNGEINVTDFNIILN